MFTIYLLDLLGTFAFAVSGAVAGIKKDMDIFGMLTLGFITAVGGGTLRDIILGIKPVFWIKDLNYVYSAFFGVIITFFWVKKIHRNMNILAVFDAAGISVFTVIGINKALEAGTEPLIALLMGIITAVFGGILRDVFRNEIPLIFRKEIYATACLAGGLLFLFVRSIGLDPAGGSVITIIFIMILRLFSIRYKLSLPKIREHKTG